MAIIYPRFSPDGRRVAVGIIEEQGRITDPNVDTDVFVLNVGRGTRTRLTFEGNNIFFPTWSPDGSRVAFGTRGPAHLYWAAADGSGPPQELLVREGREDAVTSWSGDGRAIAFVERHPDTGNDVWVLSFDGEPAPTPFVVGPFQERAAAFSPDGRWIAYVSDESGQQEVVCAAVPWSRGRVDRIDRGWNGARLGARRQRVVLPEGGAPTVGAC